MAHAGRAADDGCRVMAPRALLLVGSGDQAFREYSLRSIAERFPVALLTDRDPTWQRPYVAWHATTDFADRAGTLRAAHGLAAESDSAGLLTWDERYVELCAHIARQLGVPYCDPDAIGICKDKSRLRALLAEHADLAVRFAVAHDTESAARAAEAIGYPVVLKPRALGGSAGVIAVRDPADVEDAFADATDAHIGSTVSAYGGVLIEEYLEGPEYSVDCVTFDGETTPLVVAEKTLGLAPYFEEIGHVVPPRPHPAMKDALEQVRRVHRLAGLDRVVTHTEFRLTSRGPRIIELNTRLGGDLIPYLGLLALGVDLARAAAEAAMGKRPQLDAHADGAAAIRFFYPSTDMAIDDVSLPHADERYPGLVAFRSIVAPGQELRLPPREYLSRLAFAVATGRDQEACASCLDAVGSQLVVSGRPLVETFV
jgi:biotin carboxylase